MAERPDIHKRAEEILRTLLDSPEVLQAIRGQKEMTMHAFFEVLRQKLQPQQFELLSQKMDATIRGMKTSRGEPETFTAEVLITVLSRIARNEDMRKRVKSLLAEPSPPAEESFTQVLPGTERPPAQPKTPLPAKQGWNARIRNFIGRWMFWKPKS